ncbi:MAG: O-antigen ligase family protein [Alphaproteobacteria bacterium]
MIARAVFFLLAALLALAPLPLGSNRPWAWSALSATAAVMLALWTVAAIANPALHAIPWRRYRLIAIPAAAFFLWTAFQAASFSPAAWHHPFWTVAAGALDEPLRSAISLAPDDSLTGVMRLLGYGMIFWLAMQLGRRLDRARTLWWVLSLAITGYALYGLAEYFSGAEMILWMPKWAYQGSLTSTFVNRNHFAAYAGAGLIVTLALIADETKETARQGLHSRAGVIYFLDHMRPPLFVLMIAFVVLTTALLLSHSRAGLVCAAAGVVTMLAAFALSQGLRSKSLFAFGAIIFAVGFAVLAISGSGVAARMSELIENAGPRRQIYILALQALAERPWLGTGLGTFDNLFRLMRGEDFGASEPTYDVVHNSYLELAVEAGLPAALMLYAALGLMVLTFLHGARERRRAVIFPCSGLGVVALFGIHSLVDFSLQIPGIAATFAAICGVAYAQSWRHEERIGPQSRE